MFLKYSKLLLLLLPSILICIVDSQKVAEIVQRIHPYPPLSFLKDSISSNHSIRHKCFSHLLAFLHVLWDTFLCGWEFPVCFVPAFQFAKTGWNFLHHQCHKLNTAWNPEFVSMPIKGKFFSPLAQPFWKWPPGKLNPVAIAQLRWGLSLLSPQLTSVSTALRGRERASMNEGVKTALNIHTKRGKWEMRLMKCQVRK